MRTLERTQIDELLSTPSFRLTRWSSTNGRNGRRIVTPPYKGRTVDNVDTSGHRPGPREKFIDQAVSIYRRIRPAISADISPHWKRGVVTNSRL